MEILGGLLLPLLGTTLGSGCVFFMKKGFRPELQKILMGFAAGVMVAASVWSLLIPALEQSSDMGKWAFVPVTAGFWLGILLLLVLEEQTERMNHFSENTVPGRQRTAMLVLAVALHNLPEGMAVGVAFAGCMSRNMHMSLAGAMLLTIGIAVQNFPEGAIISMPLHSEGMKKRKAFGYGVLSGVIEPVAGLLTLFAAEFFTVILPCCLSMAAGAMFYVVVETLGQEIPECVHRSVGILAFSAGFTLMMILDVALR